MAGDATLAAAALSALGGVAVLRVAWGKEQRSHALNTAGWLLLGLSAWFGGAAGGAWGIAVTAQFAIGLALVLLGLAAIRSPATPVRASNRRAGMLPEPGERARVGRRLVTFLLVVVLSLGSAVALAIAFRGLALALGGSEADANALALFIQPLAWTGLAYAILMTPSRRRQIVIVAASAVPALPAILIGSPL